MINTGAWLRELRKRRIEIPLCEVEELTPEIVIPWYEALPEEDKSEIELYAKALGITSYDLTLSSMADIIRARKKEEMNKKCTRCYLRGTSLLGLFNTVIGCLFNRVLVRASSIDGVTIRWFWDKATNWLPVKDEE